MEHKMNLMPMKQILELQDLPPQTAQELHTIQQAFGIPEDVMSPMVSQSGADYREWAKLHLATKYGEHEHEFVYCDCRVNDPFVERECCCTGGDVCMQEPVCFCGKTREEVEG